MFHQRLCKGLWGTVAQSAQMEGDAKAGPPPTRLPQDTHTNTHITTTLKLPALRDAYSLNTAACLRQSSPELLVKVQRQNPLRMHSDS